MTMRTFPRIFKQGYRIYGYHFFSECKHTPGHGLLLEYLEVGITDIWLHKIVEFHSPNFIGWNLNVPNWGRRKGSKQCLPKKNYIVNISPKFATLKFDSVCRWTTLYEFQKAISFLRFLLPPNSISVIKKFNSLFEGYTYTRI